jgi:hypothetical protein
MEDRTVNRESILAFLRKPVTLVAIAVLVIGLVSWLGISMFQRSVDNDGIGRQRDIITLQREVGLNLSKCLDQTNIARQITDKQYASVKDILTAALSARYVDANGNATRADSTLGGGAFISSLNENYPQIDLATWKNFMSVAVGCRNDVYDSQDKLQIWAGEFDKWRQTGGIFSHNVRKKFPTDALYVYDPTQHKEVTGVEALKYLTRTILTSDAARALDTGVMPDQDLSGTPTPSH